MIWAAIERRVQTLISPDWAEGYRVRAARKISSKSSSIDGGIRQLLMDISVIRKHDAGTGIQRVTRAIGRQLSNNHPAGWEVKTVCANRESPYRETINKWTTDLCQVDSTSPIKVRPGDVFLGLDYSLDAVYRYRRQLAQFKRNGARLWFFVHDLLPIQRPEWFSDKTIVRYRKWLRVIASLADGFFCNSSSTESELRTMLLKKYGIADGYQTQIVPMGWELNISRHNMGISEEFETLAQIIFQCPTVLVVGTLEPRKGHRDVLAAFDLLWNQGVRLNLVIVGRPGWKTDDMQAALRSHSQNGRHLFWLDNASDEELERLYVLCDGVIVASMAEGYGLPLVEALGYRKPVLARDIPVFRQHQNYNVSYFPADVAPLMLSRTINQWIESIRAGQIIEHKELISSWRDAAKVMWSALS